MTAPNLEAVGQLGEITEHSWDSKDALLYAVGVGAGAVDPLDGRELPFTTENSIGVEQRVLPTFGVILGQARIDMSLLGEISWAGMVHGEQTIKVHAPIPVAGTVRNQGRITGVYDKGSGMVITVESESVLVETGQTLFTSGYSAFLRGAGGWGGDRGPSGPRNPIPDRQPDHTVTYATRPDQALIYRLSGDRNPLHSDPEVAKRAQFPKPILHGLCSFGFTGRALLHALCDGDVTRFTGMEARFAQPVFPGQSLTVKMWVTEPGKASYVTENDEGNVVISDGAATFVA